MRPSLFPPPSAIAMAVFLGCGGVARACFAAMQYKGVVAVLDSSGGVFGAGKKEKGEARRPAAYLKKGTLKALVDWKKHGAQLKDFKDAGVVVIAPLDKAYEMAYEYLCRGEMFSDGIGAQPTLVDVTAADTTDVLYRLTKGGSHTGSLNVVIANKKPVTASMHMYENLVYRATDDFVFREIRDGYFRHEATVGAGTPILATLRRMMCGGDRIKSIKGCMSGTLGFVCSGMDSNEEEFSSVVLTAKANGFTEPDPRDDLSGTDVQRKALILARLCGLSLEMSDVPVEPLYPPSMGPDKMTAEEFLGKPLKSLDADMKARVKEAADRGEVLRYVATVDVAAKTASVGLTSVPLDSPLGRLKGADNLFVIESAVYSARPLVLQGAGAGNEATAMGVVADLVEVVCLAFRLPHHAAADADAV